MHTSHVSFLTAVAFVAVAVMPLPAARADVALTATLDVAQEFPPVLAPSTATGSATLTLGADARLTGAVTFQGLTGAPQAAHIHVAPAGFAGSVLFALTLPTPADTAGTIPVATPPLSVEEQQALFAAGMYVNIHTAANPGGELRGQITVQPGRCDCDTLASGAFKQCVRAAIKGLGKDAKSDDAIKALRKSFGKASCGRSKGPKKAIACCLPFNPAENIVTDRLCATVPDKKCGKLGGTSLGAGTSCFPANPCAGSPSGAFLD